MDTQLNDYAAPLQAAYALSRDAYNDAEARRYDAAEEKLLSAIAELRVAVGALRIAKES